LVLPVIVEQSEELFVIRLEGDVNVSSVAELKAILVQGLACKKDLRIDLEQAKELDVTAMQLLWAASREAGILNRELTLRGKVPQEILMAIREAGFDAFPVREQKKQPHPTVVVIPA
jgi:ABC-type transporter Mla MlaB component